MKTLLSFALLLVVIQHAHGDWMPVKMWDVKDWNHDGDSTHGLWTNSTYADKFPGDKTFWSVTEGWLTEYKKVKDDGTIKRKALLQFEATAEKNNGKVITAEVNIWFGNGKLAEAGDPWKNEGPGALVPGETRLYHKILDNDKHESFIKFFKPNDDLWEEIDGDDLSLIGDYAFQVGKGANSKDTDNGASTWLGVDGVDEHWDINIDLMRKGEPGPTPIPEASTVFIWGIAGIFGTGLVRWRKRS